MTKFKKIAIQCMSLASVTCIASGIVLQSINNGAEAELSASAKTAIQKVNATLKTNQEDFYDDSVIYKLPETVAETDMISVIVTMDTESVMDAYDKTSKKKTLSEYIASADGRAVASKVDNERAKLIKQLRLSGVEYELGEEYDTIVSGFEVTIKASDFEKVGKLVESKGNVIVSETYMPAETEVVTNEVDVYETGIFDSSNSTYQGDGIVVAVLDTGLDYTHEAFDEANFESSYERLELTNTEKDRSVSDLVKGTVAATYTTGLTGEDVYVSRKVPYAYDYADKDPDVFPINSEHGTHVAGVIAGQADYYMDDDVRVDEEFRGVAPNAQLAIMKVFSDLQDGAKDSWILSALEDCVALGVDVINMSLGTSCGFTREEDEVETEKIYNKIREAGISLICAASNDYNATFGSEKNGSNPLTKNPDSGTVGAPSTYEAALSVASVDGVKTPYMLYNEEIIYFTEASTSAAETKDFVDDILDTLGEDVQSHDFEYVTIPGIGRSSDYPATEDDFYHGKIVLVKRGTTTFEDKVRIALKEKGAAGIIIYNNVSGTISMSVGANVGPVCSISQDEGEMLAKAGTGIIRIDRSQVAGPFMSDFSSWGPTSDLKIKPEITAHGGEILSAVPGNNYDRLSGTSMAAPNQAGAAALIRQYVKYSGVFGAEDALESTTVTDLVNKLMMSTADIIYNKNGLPFAVRKQGSGLINITKAYTSASYITTYDRDGKLMDKTKLELGDDKERTGVYEMKFDINNVSGNAVTYDIGSIVMTEGVSPTYTSHGDTTSTQEGYLLDGETSVTSVVNGSQNGNAVTVAANQSATVSVKVVLSDADKEYLEASFKYGMYVEGFITFKATSGTTVDMNVPMLAFYGDWTEAPIFDEEYYDTNKDELNAGLDPEDKLMADAYATRVIGGLYSDYISTLGEYYFQQDPAAVQIAASKDHIALSNQQDEAGSTLNSIYSIWAGLLRNVKELEISIVEDSTGKEIFNKEIQNQMKSRSQGNTVYQSSIDVDFSAIEYNLKNNTRYTVTVTTYIDYGTKAEQNNARNTFTFPLYIDFEAPIVSDVSYRTEYDKTTKKTKLFADLNIYDNHYAMGVQVGQIKLADPSSEYTFEMATFGKYVTPVYSSFNSTSTVTIELTDYVSQLKNSAGLDKETGAQVVSNNNSFLAICYDYAMNSAVYEISLPDDILSMYFDVENNTLNLSPNETKDLNEILKVFPGESWVQTLDFESTEEDIVSIVNQTLIAKQSGDAVVTAVGYDENGNKVTTSMNVHVLAEGEDGYKGNYTLPEVNKFEITGYKVNKAYYSVSTDEREIGVTDGQYEFGTANTLSMFPSESVTLKYTLDSYFPDQTTLTFRTTNSKVATVTEDGTILAKAEGNATIMVNVLFNGERTLYSGNVSISVKDPFTTNAIYLMSYKGNGGEVIVPDDRGITTIYSYAFSNYEYVEKDLEAGDVIDEEDPYYIKQMYIGEDTITSIVLPEGVTEIQAYAFAKLTALESITIPSTLEKIGVGAFYGCEKLKKIIYVDENGKQYENNLGNVQFINKDAFYGCALTELVMDEVVAIGNYAFANSKLNYIELSEKAQSLGMGAFENNVSLTSAKFDAPKMKLGSGVFAGCVQLSSIDINASVIPAYAFDGCEDLEEVYLGKDVSVIGEFAFAGTSVSSFNVNVNNPVLSTDEDGALLYKGDELILIAPKYAGEFVGGEANTVQLPDEVTSIAAGAFAGNNMIYNVVANGVTNVGAYAFAYCTNLDTVSMDKVQVIGDYAFMSTGLNKEPNLENTTSIGAYAFALTKIPSVSIRDGAVLEPYAFAFCTMLQTVEIGQNVTIGEAAFYCPLELYTFENTGSMESFNYYTEKVYEVKNENGEVVKTYSYYYYDFTAGSYSSLNKVTIGAGSKIGPYAFFGCANLTDLTLLKDEETKTSVLIGDYAFFNAASLKAVDLSGVTEIGAYAFSGSQALAYCLDNNEWQYAYEREYLGDEEILIDYEYSYFAPALEKVDLSKATKISEGAFAYNSTLKNVTLNEELTEIPAGAFALCSIETIDLPETVTKIGTSAFSNAKITEIDLTNVSEIGAYAFAGTLLKEVTLKPETKLYDGAFAYCYDLVKVENLNTVTSIGAQAFYGVALEEADVTNATYIGDYAFSLSAVQKVIFGDKLVELGQNPFFACAIETYGKEVESNFGATDITITEYTQTYDISDTVKVIDGVLYQVVPNGLELISYPLMKEAENYVVEEGTVKIGARALAGALFKNVTLPTTLKAIGDKAFYACANLSVVVFNSYEAPMLEEEYDVNYLTYQNLPYTGKLQLSEDTIVEGLGISKYYMWNVTSNYNNFYFGANFVDYIGHIEDKLIMVKPVNGEGYDTFIFAQYFDTVVEGSSAPTEATMAVISMIDALPDSIRLTDKEAVVAARAAYEAITSYEQKSLVDKANYSKLTAAESTIRYLEKREEQNNSSSDSSSDQPPKDSSSDEEDPKGCFGESYASAAIIMTVVAVMAICVFAKRKENVN